MGVAGKRLAAVEVHRQGASNQHELNGRTEIVLLLGTARRQSVTCHYAYITDDGGQWWTSWTTYYDSRADDDARTPEYRLTYPARCEAMDLANVGDPCWVLLGTDDDIRIIIAENGSVVASRLDRLFGTEVVETSDRARGHRFQQGAVDQQTLFALDLDDMDLLEFLGVPIEVSSPDLLDLAIDRFGRRREMPPTREFAAFVRDAMGLDPRDGIDDVFMEWNTTTDDLFFGLERYFLQPVLDQHFANRPTIDIDLFFEVAKSKTNSRFSRAGYTFEHHLEAIFRAHGVRYTAQSTRMDDGSKPDFLFPGRQEYDDDDLVRFVTFLGAKTTARERWMQLVAEAPRVDRRYFATRDKKLTGSVLRTMHEKGVWPVMAKPLIEEIYPAQQHMILSLGLFVSNVARRQSQIDTDRVHRLR